MAHNNRLAFLAPLAASGGLATRLRLAMAYAGMNGLELAHSAGEKPSFIYDILKGKSLNPSPTRLLRLADILGVPLNQLLEPTHLQRSAPSGVALAAPPTGMAAPPPADYYAAPFWNGEANHHGENTPEERSHGAATPLSTTLPTTLPTLAHAASSKAAPLHAPHKPLAAPFHFDRSWIARTLHTTPETLTLYSMQGDHMHPTLQPGDTLLIDRSSCIASPPGLFLVAENSNHTVRRIEILPHQFPHTLRLIADNPSYSSYSRREEEVRVLGRVVWVSRTI